MKVDYNELDAQLASIGEMVADLHAMLKRHHARTAHVNRARHVFQRIDELRISLTMLQMHELSDVVLSELFKGDADATDP